MGYTRVVYLLAFTSSFFPSAMLTLAPPTDEYKTTQYSIPWPLQARYLCPTITTHVAAPPFSQSLLESLHASNRKKGKYSYRAP